MPASVSTLAPTTPNTTAYSSQPPQISHRRGTRSDSEDSGVLSSIAIVDCTAHSSGMLAAGTPSSASRGAERNPLPMRSAMRSAPSVQAGLAKAIAGRARAGSP